MTKDTPSRIRARRFLNDKILSARVQVAINKKLRIKTPDSIVALARLNVPKGPIQSVKLNTSKRAYSTNTC